MAGASLRSDRRRRLRVEWLATAILSTALLTALVTTGATTRFDNAIYDQSMKLKRVRARADVVIVAVDQQSLQANGDWPWSRRIVAQIIGKIAQDHPKSLAFHFFYFTPSKDDQVVREAVAQAPTFLAVPHRDSTSGPGAHPVKLIADAAAGIGESDFQPDQDGIVRRTLLIEGPPDDPTPRMVTLMARLGHPTQGQFKGVSRDGEMLIPYVGPPGSFTTIPAIRVLRGQTPPNFFKNKYVILGATAPNLLDNHPTPRSGAEGMPCVEIDANVLNALLDGTGITSAPRGVILAISIALLWVLLIALLRLSPQANLRLAAGLSVLMLSGSILGVVVLGAWAPPAPYLATVSIVLPYWGWRRLNAASAYFADQLRLLERNAGGVMLAQSRSVAQKGGDVVLQQMELIEETRKRISDLRRFVADILADFPDPVLVVDRGGRILTVNQAASDFADGLAVSTAPGAQVEPVLSRIATSDGDTRALWPPPDGIDLFGLSASAIPLTGEGPSGRSYELRFTPTRSADDEPTGWIVHLADVTLLVSAMRQREEALQLLSHDMRSPLSAILASLEHPYFRDAPPTLRRRIEGQAGRTLELADAFVRMARAESADYQFELIDLSHVASDAVDSIWSLAHAGQVAVEFDLPDLEYLVLADRGMVTRAIVNLLDNAVKYSPPGKTVVCHLRPSMLNDCSAVACDIADRAGGMAQSDLDRLFRRFATSRTAQNGAAGIGLGLALVHTVVTRHNGIITCESADGEGTTFTITLPLHVEHQVHMPELTEA